MGSFGNKLNAMSHFFLTLSTVITLIFFGNSAYSEPEYAIQPCCQLCAQADNPSAYDTRFLRLNRKVIQGQGDWLFRSERDLLELFGPNDSAKKQLKRLVQKLAQKNIELVLVYQPTRGLIHYDQLPTEQPYSKFNWQQARKNYVAALNGFRAIGMFLPDLAQTFSNNNPQQEFFFRRDTHWTSFGARQTALLTAATIKQLNSYQTIAKKTYRTNSAGLIANSGNIQLAAQKLCGGTYPDQYSPQFATELVNSLRGQKTQASVALFDDGERPEIVVLGTSNTKGKEDYNFVGFLRDFLQTDVLNAAIAGGSYSGAMIEYFDSESFRQSPPKVLVWELPAHHDLSNEQFYRHVIPLVDNGCANRKTSLKRRVAISGLSTEVLFNGGGEILPIKSGEHIIDVQIAGMEMKQLKATIWYLNRRKELINYKLPVQVDNKGRFVFEMKSDEGYKNFPFLSMDFHVSPEELAQARKASGPVYVDAKICRRNDV